MDSPYYLLKSGTSLENNKINYSTLSRMTPDTSYIRTKTSGYTSGNVYSVYAEVECSNTYSRYSVVRLNNNAISLAAYRTLYVNVTTSSSGVTPSLYRFGVSTSGSINYNSFNSYVDFSFNINKAVYSLDVSSLNSTYWFYLFIQGGTLTSSSTMNITIYDLYLLA